jgi:hypothetical protein
MSFEISRLRRGERVVGVGAVLLFIFMFFFKWFGFAVPGVGGAYLNIAGVSTSWNAWHSMEVIRWLLLFTLLAGALLVALVGSDRKLQLPLSPAVVTAGLGALSTIFVFYRVIISHPFAHADVKVGAYLGLVSCAAITYGGYLAMTAEGTTLSDVRDQARAAVDSVTAPSGGSGSSGGETPSPGEPPPPA